MGAPWNPRYVAYAATNGRTPDAQMIADGGGMGLFINWIHAQWTEFHGATGDAYVIGRDRRATAEGQAAFDDWLTAAGGGA